MIATLVRHDLRWLVASPAILATALLSGFVVALVGLVALHDSGERVLAASAVLWSVATLGGLVAAARLAAAEAAGGGLRALLLAPIDRRDLFLARALTTTLVVLLLTGLTWVLLAALFPDVAALRSGALLPAVLVGALGLGTLGALTGWAALASRAGEVIGPVLAVPLATPLVIACLHASEEALAEGVAWGASLTFALGYVVALGAVSYLVSEHVVEGA